MVQLLVKDIVNLIRVRQWYKNIVIFLALFFSGNVLSLEYLLLVFFGFISLCFISSAGYIVNDMKDIQKDRAHPEKCSRPLAAKRISYVFASILLILLLFLGLGLANLLGTLFLYAVLSLFGLSLLYTFVLKKVFLADVLTIATLFVIRAISGAVVISVWISPWLVLCPFFLSLFLSVGKRHADVLLLKEKASQTRRILQGYTKEITLGLMNITTTLLIISYALYSFLSGNINLLYTLPVALFLIFRYYFLTTHGSVIARHPEKMFYDKQILVSGAVLLVLLFLFLYL